MKLITRISGLLVAVLALSGCSSFEPKSDVGIQLFMFNWNSVATECEQSLGPAGISWALVSPPQEHINGEQWWVQYQPVSYRIESRLGTREEFKNMVSRCKQAGVEIIVDAVINHMSGSSYGTGWAGSEYEKYSYKDLYTADDFHNCGLTENNQIVDYTSREQVQTCELLGLSDLKTESEEVRKKIVSYLKDLLSLGVAGFRIDAAKHISAEDLKQIVSSLPANIRIMYEVIRGGGEDVQPEEYTSSGKIWEFSFSNMITSLEYEIVPDLEDSVETGYFIDSKDAISFVTNHDTERNGKAISPQNSPEAFELATIFMLASDYGTPMLYAGYSFDDYDQPPPLDDQGKVLDARCADDPVWLCQQRQNSTMQMIKWRMSTAGQPISEFVYEESFSAWTKGEIGLFAINASSTPATRELKTSLPEGKYCNVLLMTPDETSCTGSEIVVDETGNLKLTIAPLSAVALLRN